MSSSQSGNDNKDDMGAVDDLLNHIEAISTTGSSVRKGLHPADARRAVERYLDEKRLREEIESLLQ